MPFIKLQVPDLLERIAPPTLTINSVAKKKQKKRVFLFGSQVVSIRQHSTWQVFLGQTKVDN